MKQVFWTSIVWIILICGFVLYIKWFNPTIAEVVSEFIYDQEITTDCDVPELSECITDCSECTDIEQLECPDVEPAVCNCPAQIVTGDESTNWHNLFDELNQIKVLIKSQNNSETLNEKTDEELFEEFKEWKANNYK